MYRKLYLNNKHWTQYYISVKEYRNAWYYFRKMIKAIFQ